MPTHTAVTIGVFDGVHMGHAALVRTAREAVGQDGKVVALVFDPHPIQALRPGHQPPRLSGFHQRARWLRELGVDRVERLDPTQELLGLTDEAFVEWLIERHGPAAIVEGFDFRFGKGRKGDIERLRALGEARGIEVHAVEDVETALDNQIMARVSSTAVRTLISLGRVGDTRAMLGRAYELQGTVVKGDQRGRTIGFPTANVDTDQLLPADGVYAGAAEIVDGEDAGRSFVAAVHIGPRPVFGDTRRVVEAHLLGFDRPPATRDEDYGWTIRVRIERWLRDLVRIDGVDALIAQIGRDVDRTRQLVSLEKSEQADARIGEEMVR